MSLSLALTCVIASSVSAQFEATQTTRGASIDWTQVRPSEFFASASPGGPGGNFDWQIPDGQTFLFSTSSQLIVGGPDFAPTTELLVTDGLIELDDLRVGVGAKLIFSGPNPVRIFATGSVGIQGEIHVDGSNSIGVVVLNTTNIPEAGALGNSGGGQGGTASPMVAASSPRGGSGWGPFATPEVGGQGGEAGWSTNPGLNGIFRRAAGGGGGVFASDQQSSANQALVDETLIGLNAEPGFNGPTFTDPNGIIGAFGAENPELFESPPDGGLIGSSPFVDSDPSNDFFGRKRDPVTGTLVVGELTRPWAGAGGGGGGDASNVPFGSIYPPPFSLGGDEKGGAGGGGGGHLTILALGPIGFGPQGQISARGGHGGGGESTNFVNRIGGAGGGGSGGHVILQSSSAIDFTQLAAGEVGLNATGGQGGAGANDDGGAKINGETTPNLDACPAIVSDCGVGPVVGAGGDGGPGVLQLHVRGGLQNILLPAGRTLEDIGFPTPVGALVPFRFPGLGLALGR